MRRRAHATLHAPQQLYESFFSCAYVRHIILYFYNIFVICQTLFPVSILLHISSQSYVNVLITHAKYHIYLDDYVNYLN